MTDAVFVIHKIIEDMPGQENIPWEVKNEVIEDLAQYFVMRASQVAAWGDHQGVAK